MSTLKILQNPARKVANKRRRRRNTATVTKTVANRRRRRRNTASVATRNTTATKTVANRRRRRRRNPATLTATVANRRHHKRRRRNGVRRVNNGLLGNTKSTAYAVGALLFGLGAVKFEAPLVMPFVSQFLTPLGFGQYSRPLTEAGLAVVNSWVAKMVSKKIHAPEAPKMVLIGGLAMAAMDLIVTFLPTASAYNPFAVANVAPVQIPAATTAAAMSGFMRPRVGSGYRRPVIQ